MADERDELDEAIDCIEWIEAMEPGCTWARTERARSIRARERKLAELAHEIARMRNDETTYPKMKDWIRRYEEATR